MKFTAVLLSLVLVTNGWAQVPCESAVAVTTPCVGVLVPEDEALACHACEDNEKHLKRLLEASEIKIKAGERLTESLEENFSAALEQFSNIHLDTATRLDQANTRLLDAVKPKWYETPWAITGAVLALLTVGAVVGYNLHPDK